MKFAIVANAQSRHQSDHAKWMAEGLTRNGHSVEVVGRSEATAADAYVAWGWRNAKSRREANKRPVLVMERGYVGDRFRWTSLAWNGLNGRGVFSDRSDPRRWEKNFAHLMLPPAEERPVAVLMGQVKGDASLEGVAIEAWYAQAAEVLKRSGWEVVFRPHPVAIHRGQPIPNLRGCFFSKDLLEVDLARAGLVVTFNSNSGVDAALAGVPVFCGDPGSMAWPVRTRSIDLPTLPDRADWAHRLAWKQWSPDEIRDGSAVAALMEVIPECS